MRCVARRWRTIEERARGHSARGLSRWSSTAFVSKHNSISADEVDAYVNSRIPDANSVKLNNEKTHYVYNVCPSEQICGSAEKYSRRRETGNQWKMHVLREGGPYFCHRCGSKGSFFDLKKAMSGVEFDDSGSRSLRSVAALSPVGGSAASEPVVPDQGVVTQYPRLLMAAPADDAVVVYLEERGFDFAVLAKYGVGRATRMWYDDAERRMKMHECVTFPWIVTEGARSSSKSDDAVKEDKDKDKGLSTTVRVKLRSITEKSRQRLEPTGGGWGLFGLHTVPADCTEIVLTEGEFDAMAVHQATGRYAISVPNGASSLPPAVLPLLERFTSIVLWMDSDEAGVNASRKFSEKLGAKRCFVVEPPTKSGKSLFKDANEALLAGASLEDVILSATRPQHKEVVHFSELRDEVMRQLRNPEVYAGNDLPSFPQLTKLLLGVRLGELSLLTGPTGAGKTTMASQISIDLLERGMPTLWGSFEVKNTALAVKMLRQKSGNAPNAPATLECMSDEQLESLCDDFEQLPLHFMRFHGATDTDDVIDAMSYAVYVHDVSYVVLDNLQFMTSTKTGRGFNDKFEAQDMAVSKFRKFATENNVHVVLVVHPRKENPHETLSLTSIYGGAKATQEADNVFILQAPLAAKDPPSWGRGQQQSPANGASADAAAPKPRPRKYLELAKNRFSGNLGSIPLAYDPQSCRYREYTGS